MYCVTCSSTHPLQHNDKCKFSAAEFSFRTVFAFSENLLRKINAEQTYGGLDAN